MATYQSSNPARCIMNLGMVSAQGSTLANNIFLYSAGLYSSDITASRFFTGCALNSYSTNAIGMSLGDLVCNIAPGGLVSWHTVTSITTSTAAANTGLGNSLSSLDATVSAASS